MCHTNNIGLIAMKVNSSESYSEKWNNLRLFWDYKSKFVWNLFHVNWKLSMYFNLMLCCRCKIYSALCYKVYQFRRKSVELRCQVANGSIDLRISGLWKYPWQIHQELMNDCNFVACPLSNVHYNPPFKAITSLVHELNSCGCFLSIHWMDRPWSP